MRVWLTDSMICRNGRRNRWCGRGLLGAEGGPDERDAGVGEFGLEAGAPVALVGHQ